MFHGSRIKKAKSKIVILHLEWNKKIIFEANILNLLLNFNKFYVLALWLN